MHALAARGGLGGQRVAQPDELVGGDLVADQPAHLVDVAGLAGREAGLGRLDDRHAAAAGAGDRGEGGRDDGLADVGARAGDEDDGGQRARVGHQRTGSVVAERVSRRPVMASRTSHARSRSSSVWSAWAVRRSRDEPSGVDGGRKHPIRMPCAAGLLDGVDRLERSGHRHRHHRARGGRDTAGGREARGVGVQPGDELGVLAQDLDRRQRGPGRGRREPGVVDEGARGVDEVLADDGGGEDRTALCRKGLREGARDDDVLGERVGGRGDEAAAARADDPEGVRLVDDEDRPHLGREGDEVLDRRGVAEDGVDRLGDDDGAGDVTPAQQLGVVLEVVVPRDGDGRPRQAAPVDEAGVGVLVADDEGAGVGEGAQRREVGRVAAGEDEGGGGAGEGDERCSSSSWTSRVPVTSREAPAPVP